MISADKNTAMDILNNPVLKSFIAGSFSGTCSTILFQPLDLVKTRLQNPIPATIGAPTTPGMFNLMGHIIEKEHLRGLWKGMTPSLTRTVPGVGLYFSSLHWLKGHFVEPGKELQPLQAVTLGVVARTMSGVCMIPITVIKTRYESGVYEYRGVTAALRVIYKTEGVKGLCCGLVPTLFRDAPFSGLYLLFYTQTKKSLPQEWWSTQLAAPLHFSCGIVAGLLASAVTQPADVVKTKMQLYPDKYANILSVMAHIQRKYGVRGYFKGLAPRMLRRTLMAAMAWTVYEHMMRNLGIK
ncbi:mitochondrial glycine transporter B-like [Neocloeon triangulifer]|uniref:mitochondrial glycine transporter B-like n=1 Tax=Neocloeon triangulifer TaxID=2078957 RepID=UPI00286ED8EB|nr:mitochondrial glycine transporter B-like [Neocloeon triangulifer]